MHWKCMHILRSRPQFKRDKNAETFSQLNSAQTKIVKTLFPQAYYIHHVDDTLKLTFVFEFWRITHLSVFLSRNSLKFSHSLAVKKGCQDWMGLWNSFSNAFQTLLFSTPASVRWNENAVSCLPCCLARFLFYLLFVLQELYQNGRDKTESCFEYAVTSSLCMRMCVCTFMSVSVCVLSVLASLFPYCNVIRVIGNLIW